MISAEKRLGDICTSLKHNFLYNKDLNSIHILLNLYDIENKMMNISPTYISTNDIRKKIKSHLAYRKDREAISNNIMNIIHEDIDRLELIFNIEGYSLGYYNTPMVNKLEELVVQKYSIDKLYDYRNLLKTNSESEMIKKLKTENFIDMYKYEEKYKDIYEFVDMYCKEFIRNKVFRFNENLNRQLKIEYRYEEIYLIEEKNFLTINEIDKIYDIIKERLYTNIIEIYTEASWFGINDRLLNRY